MKTTYTLVHPVKFGSEDILELEVTKPTPKILKKYDMNNLTMGDQIKLAADCTGQPSPLIEILDLIDYMGVVNILTDWFLEASQRR
jgi:hypothetical protein